MTFKPTHRWAGPDVADAGVPHPLRGLPCEIVSRDGMSKAGYDVTVRTPARPAAERFAMHPDGMKPPAWDAERYMQMFAEQEWLKGDYVELEANMEEELEPI